MVKVKAEVLKFCRERKGLSQDELSKRAKIDKGTISRIERGKADVRPRTVDLLAKCLDVTTDVLTGQSALPTATVDQPADSKSQLNIRIQDSARNALTLVAHRYSITPAEIIELAPFLFECAATRSLQRRREGVEKMEQLFSDGQQVQRVANDHLNFCVFAPNDSEEILRTEKKSIDKNDIKGDLLNDMGDDFGPEILDPNCEENPFVTYLKSLGGETEGRAEFESWWSSPLYTVCWPEMLVLAGGDTAIAEHIQDGMIALHEMPKEVRSGDKTARLAWLQEKKVEADQKAQEMLDGLTSLLKDMAEKKDGSK